MTGPRGWIYTTSRDMTLQSLANISHVPVYVWGGNPEPDGNMSTKDLWYDPGNCGVTSGSWYYSQRLKQWRVNHTETWNNVTDTMLAITKSEHS